MLKVLVADDEQLERQALRHVLEKYCRDVEIIGLAANGREAISLCRSTHPDIVFIDIKMPGVDGLETIRVVGQEFPQVKIVLLSAYDEFSYAQEAVKLGVSDYILKPARPQEIAAVVARLTGVIRAERERNANEKRLQNQLEETMPFIKTAFVYDLINGNIEGQEEYLERAAFLKLSLIPGVVLIVDIDGFATKTSSQSEVKRQLLKTQVFAVVETALSHYPQGIVTTLGGDKLVVLYSPRDGSRELVFQLANLIRGLVKPTGFTVTVGIGRYYSDLRELHRSFGEAQRAVQYGFILGADQAIHIDDIVQEQEESSDYPLREERALLRWLRLGDEKEAREAFEQLFQKIIVGSPGQLEVVKARVLELLIVMSRAAVEGGAPVGEASRRNLTYISQIGGIQHCEDLKGWLLAALDEYLQGVNAQHHRLRSQAITRAKDYLAEHYARDISLEEVATYVNLSPYYFSRLFRQEEGVTFVEYLTRLRISQAKRLLHTSEDSILTIALKVGYSEANYFSRVFRKLEGCTPSHFREGQAQEADLS